MSTWWNIVPLALGAAVADNIHTQDWVAVGFLALMVPVWMWSYWKDQQPK